MMTNDDSSNSVILVDVIIPVHNAENTVEDAVRSAMNQEIPESLIKALARFSISVSVCCYDDGSNDNSWKTLQRLNEEYASRNMSIGNSKSGLDGGHKISSTLIIENSPNGIARGAGYARNRAIGLHIVEKNENSDSNNDKNLHFLCLLDSDDTMHRYRVSEQTSYMIRLDPDVRLQTLLGCNFDRYPPDSTWHYSQWANSLSDERLMLERYREVTILQPTWFLCRSRWSQVGGYVEAPPPNSQLTASKLLEIEQQKNRFRLIHPHFDNEASLRLAEDLRFFHEHLQAHGIIRLHRTSYPLVTYRHVGSSQSFRTSRKLLLQLRALAFEKNVLDSVPPWQKHQQKEDYGQFVIWGAGRDGKEFLKCLSLKMRKQVYCFVDVDTKKLESGWYVNRDLDVRIPIVHFSLLAKDEEVRRNIEKDWAVGNSEDEVLGRINKTKETTNNPSDAAKPRAQKKQRTAKSFSFELRGLCPDKLQQLPVVVCVAMYRTSGVLEKNVRSIGRQEGVDLWHFC